MAEYEYAGIGIQSWNTDGGGSTGGYSFQSSVEFLFVDTFLYLFLAWYVDQVIPRSLGKSLPLYFLFLPRYWMSDDGIWRGRKSIGKDCGVDKNEDDDDDDELSAASASSIDSWSTTG